MFGYLIPFVYLFENDILHIKILKSLNLKFIVGNIHIEKNIPYLEGKNVILERHNSLNYFKSYNISENF